MKIPEMKEILSKIEENNDVCIKMKNGRNFLIRSNDIRKILPDVFAYHSGFGKYGQESISFICFDKIESIEIGW